MTKNIAMRAREVIPDRDGYRMIGRIICHDEHLLSRTIEWTRSAAASQHRVLLIVIP